LTNPSQSLVDGLQGRYSFERELGRGGMATVHLARDLRHKRPVALKVLHPELAQSLGPERFLREIEIAAGLQHPHILTVLDSGQTAGYLWYTMPFVEGESLRDRLTREGQLPLEDAVRLGTEVADALGFAHTRGVIHRDIKPENILLSAGHALVADFGVARAIQDGGQSLTSTGTSVGTPAYMSPEQAMADQHLDGRSDLYSLGCVVYEMLAGEPPYVGRSAQAIVAKRLTDPVPSVRRLRDTVPSGVDLALSRVLAKAAADRFPTAAAFAEALRVAEREPVVTSAAVPVPSPRRRLRPAVLGAVLATVAVTVALLWRGSRGASPPAANDGPTRLAVLPFENRGAPTEDYFADGMTDEVRGKLSALPGLKVIARTSSSEYKKSGKPPSQIGKELGVQYLLTATVRWEKRPDGDRVRVSPELIETRDASTRWQQPFDAAMTDVFTVQANIATDVARALDLVLESADRQALGVIPTGSLPAYDAFLRGEEESASLTRVEPVTLRRAMGYYAKAVALDSTFAQAWLQLALGHAMTYMLGYDPTPARKDSTRRAVERVVALRPDGYESRWARMVYYGQVLGDRRRGAAEIEEGLRLAPRNPAMLAMAAFYEISDRKWDQAAAHLQEAALLDPRSVHAAADLANLYFSQRRFPEATVAIDRALSLDPGNLNIRVNAAYLRVANGDVEGGRRVIHEAPPTVSRDALVALVAGNDTPWLLDDESQQAVLRLTPAAFDNDRTTWGAALASTYLLRGDTARALAYEDSARVAQEVIVRGDPDNADQRQHLALMYAFLGRKVDAVREGERALAQVRQGKGAAITDDASFLAYVENSLARVYILVGEPEKALDLLESALKVPSYITAGWVQVDPHYAPLRGNPRFERIVASAGR
jgi:serine/threonine-protein kinase